jgi:hypothetical protein
MLLQAFVWSCWVNAFLSLAMAGFLVCSGRSTYLKNLWIAVSLAVTFWSAGQAVMASTADQHMAYISAIVANCASSLIPVTIIAKGWIESHGGRIWAESEGRGKGTSVTFTLPAATGTCAL